jgi:hypothetical protein
MYSIAGFKHSVRLTTASSAKLMSIRGTFALGYDDIPLTFFKNEQEMLKKHGQRAFWKYINEGERPAKLPTNHKQRLKYQVSAAYKVLAKPQTSLAA